MSVSVIELYKNGTLKQLCDSGLMSCNVLEYFEYYQAFEVHRLKTSYREAIMLTAIDFKVSESTIERAQRIIRQIQNKPLKQ